MDGSLALPGNKQNRVVRAAEWVMETSQPCQEIKAKVAALTTRRDVASMLGITDHALRYQLYAKNRPTGRFTRFEIRKKSGGTRPIIAPVGWLKTMQVRLHRILQCIYEPKPMVHGFTRERCIVTNATPHLERKWVLNIDIENFFPTINFGRVRGMFMAAPYSLPEEVSTVLAGICCFENQLPQGAPTSPIVANMLCARLDAHLSRLAGRTGAPTRDTRMT